MKLKTPSGDIQLGDWVKIRNIYWLRQDLSELRSDWAREFGYNNAVGFLTENSAPRFFGEEVNFLIEEWWATNTLPPSDIEKAKEAMDNFFRSISEE